MKKFFTQLAILALFAAGVVTLVNVAGCDSGNNPINPADGSPNNPGGSGGGTGGGGLTADVGFTTTLTNSSNTTLNGSAGEGTANQTLTLTANDNGIVYFAAQKAAAQTITSSDSNVTVAESGTVDGDQASGARSVFAVTTGKLPFEGGTRNLTLTVSEPGKQSLNVTVTLNVAPNPTGVAIFKVTDNAFNPATGAEGAAATYTRIHAKKIDSPLDDIVTLFDAIKWVNEAAAVAAGDEYLVRVEASELLPRIFLSCKGLDNVKIRLRGYGSEERILKHNGTAETYTGTSTMIASSADAFINVGFQMVNNQSPYPAITLQLEKNITIEGNGNSQSANYRAMLQVYNTSTLIMQEDSKITKHFFPSITISAAVIFISAARSLNTGRFIMYGGKIIDNVFTIRDDTSAPLIGTNVGSSFLVGNAVQKVGGIINNPNGNNMVKFNNNIFRINENDSTTPYLLPGL